MNRMQKLAVLLLLALLASRSATAQVEKVVADAQGIT